MRSWTAPRPPPSSPAHSPAPRGSRSAASGGPSERASPIDPRGGGRNSNAQSPHAVKRTLQRGDRAGGAPGDAPVGVRCVGASARAAASPIPGRAASPTHGSVASPVQESCRARAGPSSPVARQGGGRISLVGAAAKPRTPTPADTGSGSKPLWPQAPADAVDATERACHARDVADTCTQTEEFWFPFARPADGALPHPGAPQSQEPTANGASGAAATPLRGPQAFSQGAMQACAGLVIAPTPDQGDLSDSLDPKTWPVIRDPAVWAICRHATSFACDALAEGHSESPARGSPKATGRSLTPSRMGGRMKDTTPTMDERPTPMLRARLEAAERLLVQVTAERDHLRQVSDLVLSLAEQGHGTACPSTPRTPNFKEDGGSRFDNCLELATAAKLALRNMHAAMATREKEDRMPIIHQGCASSACSTGSSGVLWSPAGETPRPMASIVVPSEKGGASLSCASTSGDVPASSAGTLDTPIGEPRIVSRLQSQQQAPAAHPPHPPSSLQQAQPALCSSASTPILPRRPPTLVVNASGPCLRQVGQDDAPALQPGTPTGSLLPCQVSSASDFYKPPKRSDSSAPPAAVMASGASASTDVPSSVSSLRPPSPMPPRCEPSRRAAPPCSPAPAAGSRSLSPSRLQQGGRSMSVTRRHFRTQQVWVLEREEHFVVNSHG